MRLYNLGLEQVNFTFRRCKHLAHVNFRFDFLLDFINLLSIFFSLIQKCASVKVSKFNACELKFDFSLDLIYERPVIP